jgi:pimeloyl-ACP methyl ester carboxylesterase
MTTNATPRFDAAIGRYVYLTIDGVEYRTYFESNGTGIPLLLQHTAGADGRQWRHVLEDAELARHFQLIAYDLPYHGKSVPPTGERWWAQEYRLTRDFLVQVPVTLARALGLARPLYMGSSIGGHLALDLARERPDDFRAVIGLEAAAYTPGGYVDDFHHPNIGNDYKAHLMYGLMSPTSPEAFRRETLWVYSQGAPSVFKGDLYYYSVDHDLREGAEEIDTNRLSVDILNGEYDWSGTPAMGEAVASRIPGARYQTMPGLGHFPMSEDPVRFLDLIRPVLLRAAGITP